MRALRDDTALPSVVRGPVDFCALARLAWSCLIELMAKRRMANRGYSRVANGMWLRRKRNKNSRMKLHRDNLHVHGAGALAIDVDTQRQVAVGGTLFIRVSDTTVEGASAREVSRTSISTWRSWGMSSGSICNVGQLPTCSGLLTCLCQRGWQPRAG